jgi:hypothetical protein
MKQTKTGIGHKYKERRNGQIHHITGREVTGREWTFFTLVFKSSHASTNE